MRSLVPLTEQHSLAHHLKQATLPTLEQQQHYQQQYQQALDFPAEAILVLDANVLLGYAQLPVAEQQRFYAFLEKEQARIYWSAQVQQEYQRHIKVVRQQQRHAVQHPGLTTAQQALRPALADYLEREGPLLEHYPKLLAQWRSVYANSGAWLKRLRRHAQAQTTAGREWLEALSLTPLMAQWSALPALAKTTRQALRQQLQAFTEQVAQENPKGFANAAAAYAYRHPEQVFPGLGDAGRKPMGGLGDYIIYHELLQLALQQTEPRPIIFLTNDHIKGDWMTVQQTPYWHYYHHFATQTHTLCHILPAQPWLYRHAQVDFNPLLEQAAIWRDMRQALWQSSPALDAQNLPELLATLYPNRPKAQTDWEGLLEELAEDVGVFHLGHLETLLLERYPRLVAQEQALQTVHDRLGALCLSLDLPL